MTAEPTIDDCQAELLRLGWSAGDALVLSPVWPQWNVYLQRRGERVVAKAESQTDAWREALRVARQIGVAR